MTVNRLHPKQYMVNYRARNLHVSVLTDTHGYTLQHSPLGRMSVNNNRTAKRHTDLLTPNLPFKAGLSIWNCSFCLYCYSPSFLHQTEF